VGGPDRRAGHTCPERDIDALTLALTQERAAVASLGAKCTKLEADREYNAKLVNDWEEWSRKAIGTRMPASLQVLDLRFGAHLLRLERDTDNWEWCRVYLNGPDKWFLGADSHAIVVGRLLRGIAEPPGLRSMPIDKGLDDRSWVLTLSETHFGIYRRDVGTAPADSVIHLCIYDEEGQARDVLPLSAEERLVWLQQLAACA
jgi:hypothetical protein